MKITIIEKKERNRKKEGGQRKNKESED